MDGEREEIGLGKTRHTQVVSYKSRIRWFHEWIHTLEYHKLSLNSPPLPFPCL